MRGCGENVVFAENLIQ